MDVHLGIIYGREHLETGRHDFIGKCRPLLTKYLLTVLQKCGDILLIQHPMSVYNMMLTLGLLAYKCNFK